MLRWTNRTRGGDFTLLLAALLLCSCGAFEPPAATPPVPIEYPIEHYRVTDSGTDFALWKQEVSRLRESLREEYPYNASAPQLQGSSKEDEFIDRAVDPKRVVWKDPSAFWREPVLLSWWELIDDKGEISRVVIVSSNQSPEDDAKIIAWCLDGKHWQAPIIDGHPTASIRSASINLGESSWNIAHWQKKVPAQATVVIVVVIIAVVVQACWSLARRRRSRKN